MKQQRIRATVVGLMATLAFPVIVLAQPAPEGATERYEIDASHSHVGFSVRHLAITNVRGNFQRFSGHIMLNEQDITKSTVNVTVDVASIDTDNDARDADLRGEEFFETAKYPHMTFVGKRIDRDGSDLVLVGDLTMRGVTKEVRIPFELVGPVTSANGQKRLGAEGSLRINRFDYGLKWNALREAVPVVGEEVRIELNIEAVTPRQR